MPHNQEFHRVLAPYEYEHTIIPKQLIFDRFITPNALLLLLVMIEFGKRPNWKLWRVHLMKETGFGEDKYSNAIESLESAGYVEKIRVRIKGQFTNYHYKYSAFPIFRKGYQMEQNPAHNEYEPDGISQSGTTRPVNPDLTSRYKNNVLEKETTKLPKQKVPKENLVSSSFQIEKLDDLEAIEKISTAQKNTLYKKFSHETIRKSISAIDISRARSVFALLIKACEDGYEPNKPESEKYKQALEVYENAQKWLDKRTLKTKKTVHLSIDKKKNKIYIQGGGTAISTFDIQSETFLNDFTKRLNDLAM